MSSDADAIAQADYAAGVSPAVSANATARHASTDATVQINGVSNDYFAAHSYVTVSGSLFDAIDIAERTQAAVIDEDTSATFFSDGSDPVGEVQVCLVGGILGIALAWGGGMLAGALSDSVRLSFSPLSVVVAFLSSTMIGIIFGLLPARSAARLDPVVALSRE